MSRFVVALALALTALTGSPILARADEVIAAGAPPAFDANLIRPDPAIRRGVLQNGLKYAVMRNAAPEGGVSLRLGVDVGSFEERDDERGAAHFVEHMVFNGSKSFPEGQIDKVFQPLGVAFGRDQNAATGLYSTVYGLDLHNTAPAPLQTAFRWLRDVADGALFDDKAVNRERGVILAEREASLSPIEETSEALRVFQGQGLRSTDRDPIGTLDVLRKVDGATLRAFYKRWYRPEHAMVVVVGDLPVETLEKMVADAFSDWRGEGPPPPRSGKRAPDLSRGAQTLVRTEPNAPTLVEICRSRAVDPLLPDDVAAMRRRTASLLWRRTLDKRLARLAASDAPPFLSANVFFSDESREAANTCLMAVALEDRWRPALDALEAEFRRLQAQGPTDAELETAIEDVRSRYRGAAGASTTRDTAGLAQAIVELGLNGTKLAAPRESFRAYDQAVEDLTPDDIKAAIARDWTGAGPLLAVVGAKPPAEAGLRTAWVDGEKAPLLPPYVEPKATKFAYEDFGKPGAVAKREKIADGDFTRVTFKNGVILNIKPTNLSEAEVVMDVRFGRGRGDIANKDDFLASMAAPAFKSGGLGRESIEELTGQFPAATWDADLDIGFDAFRLKGRTNKTTLDRQLAILAAYMTDPGFRPAMDARLPAMMKAAFQSYQTSPELVMSSALDRALDPVDGGLPPEEAALKIRAKDFERVLKPIIVNAPMEVSIVGDVDEREAIAQVAATFGALPPRDPNWKSPRAHRFLKVSDSAPRLIRATHDGSGEKAIASLIWPLWTATPERRREEMALNVAAEIFNNKIRNRVREDLGKSYAPEAATNMPDHADQGLLTAVIETYPDDVEAVVEEAKKIALDLAAGKMDKADFDEALQPMVAQMHSDARTNSFWLDVISGSAADARRAPDIVGLEALTASLTLDEVKKVAAAWMGQKPIVVIAAPKGRSGVQAAR